MDGDDLRKLPLSMRARPIWRDRSEAGQMEFSSTRLSGERSAPMSSSLRAAWALRV
jgi:hypothetical protein